MMHDWKTCPPQKIFRDQVIAAARSLDEGDGGAPTQNVCRISIEGDVLF